MGRQIDEFCEELRQKLTNIDSGLEAVKAKIDSKAHGADEAVRSHLADVQRRIELDRAKIVAARAEIKAWFEVQKSATDEKIAEWKAAHNVSQLQSRADRAERYEIAARAVALAAADEAEQAALEAWLARRDANAAVPKAAKIAKSA